MDCQICSTAPLKYKCPSCKILYCLLLCYRDLRHNHPTDNKSLLNSPHAVAMEKELGPISDQGNMLEIIARDDVILEMLKHSSLQFHLHVLSLLLHDTSLLNALNSKDRYQVMNLKLNDLRSGGIEANCLIENFITRVFYLKSELERNIPSIQ